MDGNEEPLRLPAGYELISYMTRQVPAPGGIYRASFPGDLEALFGPVRELRDREFLLELGDRRWLAAPTPGMYVSSSGDGVMVFDTGSIYAQTNGGQSTIDFQLLREAD